MEETPEVGGDTAWVSGYGLYDELSPHMQKLLEGLHAVHTSRLQYETTIVSTDLLFYPKFSFRLFRLAQLIYSHYK